MSQPNTTETSSTEPAVPPYRYRAALAAEVEARWQDRWDADHTYEAPNPEI